MAHPSHPSHGLLRGVRFGDAITQDNVGAYS